MIEMNPDPVPCQDCGTILQAIFARENGYLCPGCGSPVCYICGCTEEHGCIVQLSNLDQTATQTYRCWWAELGSCSTCFGRYAYELYQKATGRPASNPLYMSVGRSACGVATDSR